MYVSLLLLLYDKFKYTLMWTGWWSTEFLASANENKLDVFVDLYR